MEPRPDEINDIPMEQVDVVREQIVPEAVPDPVLMPEIEVYEQRQEELMYVDPIEPLERMEEEPAKQHQVIIDYSKIRPAVLFRLLLLYFAITAVLRSHSIP